MIVDGTTPFKVGDWKVNPITGRLTLVSGETIELTPKIMKLLVYLSSRSGEMVSTDDLMTHVWDNVKVSDTSLYYTINKLRTALGDDSQKPIYIETISKRGYRLIAEVTHEGLPSVPKRTKLVLLVSIICMLIVVVITFRYRVSIEPNEIYASPNSIAVLPFVNMSEDANNEYFSDGVSEEILNLLAQIPDLHVTSRSSSFQYKGEGIHIPKVANELGVANILEGSVRKSGSELRITAQLIDARNDKHLWSAIYHRELVDVFDVQQEISEAIVNALGKILDLELIIPKTRTFIASSEAREALMRGRYLASQRSRATIKQAVIEFQKAVDLEPNYATAHAELGMTTMLLVGDQYGTLSYDEALNLAEPHVKKALKINPSSAEANAAKGMILAYQQKPEEGVAYYRRAIKFNPNYATVQSWMANLLEESLGGYEEAYDLRKKALLLDPLSKPARSHKVLEDIARNQFTEADQNLEKLSSFAPAFHAHVQAQRDLIDGQWANAVLGNLDALKIRSDFAKSRFHLSFAFAKIDLPNEALSIFGVAIPHVLAMLGENQRAVSTAEAWLARSPASSELRRFLGQSLAGAGYYRKAKSLLEEQWENSNGLVSSKGMFQITHAAALIAIRRANGDNDGVEELIEAIRENGRQLRKAGIIRSIPLEFPFDAGAAEGMAAFLSGEHERGLTLLSAAAEKGLFIWPNEAYMQSFYDQPEFNIIMEKQKARQKRERTKFLNVVCTDNPYIDVWQPAKGTCEMLVK